MDAENALKPHAVMRQINALGHSSPWKLNQTPSIRTRLQATETFEYLKIATLSVASKQWFHLQMVLKMKTPPDRKGQKPWVSSSYTKQGVDSHIDSESVSIRLGKKGRELEMSYY